jgi:hypothetical protein
VWIISGRAVEFFKRAPHNDIKRILKMPVVCCLLSSDLHVHLKGTFILSQNVVTALSQWPWPLVKICFGSVRAVCLPCILATGQLLVKKNQLECIKTEKKQGLVLQKQYFLIRFFPVLDLKIIRLKVFY